MNFGNPGIMLIMAKDEDAATTIKNELSENHVNPCARFPDFSISPTGFSVAKN